MTRSGGFPQISVDIKLELATSFLVALVGSYFHFVSNNPLPWHVLAYSVSFGLAGSALLCHWAWGNRSLSMFKVLSACLLASVLSSLPVSWYIERGEKNIEMRKVIEETVETVLLYSVPPLKPSLDYLKDIRNN